MVICLCRIVVVIDFDLSWEEVSHAWMCRSHLYKSLCSIWRSTPLECTPSSRQLRVQRSMRRHRGSWQLVHDWTRGVPCPSSGVLPSQGTHRTSCPCLLRHDDTPAGHAQLLCCFYLVKEQGFQYANLWNLGNTSYHLVPITDESTEVVTFELHAE